MTKPRTKKPIPLDGEALSTGVLIAKATATQLNMEAGRLIKVAAQRCAELGVKIDQDDLCRKALDRSGTLLNLCKDRIRAEAEAAGVEVPKLD